MKKVLTIAFLIQHICYSQIIDTNCYHSRLIQLYPTIENQDVFCLDSNISLENDLVAVIKKQVLENNLNLYKLNLLHNGSSEWQYIDLIDDLKEAKADTTNILGWEPYFTRFGPIPDYPIVDETGEPIIFEDDEGYSHYVYPPIEVFQLKTMDLSNVIIKEIRTRNSDDKLKFRISDIGFYLKANEDKRSKELFWINFEELKLINLDLSLYPWFNALNEQKYSGPIIKQGPCFDMEINLEEDRHPKVIEIDDSCSCKLTLNMIRNENSFVVNVPQSCNKGVKVQFAEGGTQTDISINEILDSNEEFYSAFSFANPGDRDFIVVKDKQQLKVRYRPCHYRKEFKIFVE